jgi:DNA-binding NtrC family response regulator
MNDKANILLVDDEERVLRSLEMLFRNRFKVYTTTDGNEAVDICRRDRIHVVVSDQRMPAITGVEVLRRAREVSPNTMRLLLTGYSDLQAIVRGFRERGRDLPLSQQALERQGDHQHREPGGEHRLEPGTRDRRRGQRHGSGRAGDR